MEIKEHNLSLDLVRITEVAAISSARWLGKGDKDECDRAAVEAMRLSFNSLSIDGSVIIGEGEKDCAPMLYKGEKLGTGQGAKVDIAVDPVEGTRLLAFGRPNAISVIGVAPAGKMFDPGPSYYMKKLVVPYDARNAIDIDAPVSDNLTNIAKALQKNVDDLIVFVLDKPRHKELIHNIRQVGARIQLHTDGDVAGALMVVDASSEIDVMMGTGGTPEGVLSACAIKALGGEILCKFDPQKKEENEALNRAGIDQNQILDVNTLIKSDDIFFTATGISGGTFLRGVNFTDSTVSTHSVVIRGTTGTIRYIESFHNKDKLLRFGIPMPA